MQARGSQQTRNFNFPSSHEQVEIITYKNDDGTFKNAEVVMTLLKRAFLEINDIVIGSRISDATVALFFRVLSPNAIQLLEFKIMPGTNKIDYATEKLLSTLTIDEIGQIKHTAISSITTFFELFSHYYTVKSSRDQNLHGVINDELLSLLRFSNGAKIKYLDDLLSLYLALNGQTYFDVTCHAMISGSHTFGSLFSITGLYYAANSKLNGKTMLVEARQRNFTEDYNVRDKGEIHTKQGLTVLYSRQFKVRSKRTSQTKRNIVYELMTSVDEDQNIVNDDDRPSTSDSSVRRVYEQVKEFKLLTLVGLQELETLQYEFLDIINKNSSMQEKLKKEVKSGNISSLIHILTIFDDGSFVDVFKRLDSQLVHKHDRMIINRVFEIDLFGVSTHKDIFNRNLIRFLSLLESMPLESDLTDSIVKRFKNSSDCTDLVLRLIDEFLELIG